MVLDVRMIRAGAQGGFLEGVEAAEAQEPWLREREEAVRAAALALLARGLREGSQPDVGAALQVFFNLGDLQGAVQGVMADQATAVGRELDAALARPRGVARGEGRSGPRRCAHGCAMGGPAAHRDHMQVQNARSAH